MQKVKFGHYYMSKSHNENLYFLKFVKIFQTDPYEPNWIPDYRFIGAKQGMYSVVFSVESLKF